MSVNEGKDFEADFKKSIPKNWFVTRLKDSASGWGQSDNLRFTSSNLCDFIVFTGKYLFLSEIKTHKGASIPLTAVKQLKGLQAIHAKNTIPCLILRYADKDETFLLPVCEGMDFGQKSIPIGYCREHGYSIARKKLIVHYRYDIKKTFDDYVNSYYISVDSLIT